MQSVKYNGSKMRQGRCYTYFTKEITKGVSSSLDPVGGPPGPRIFCIVFEWQAVRIFLPETFNIPF